MSAFLLVDGDRNFRRATEIALRLEGAEVASAESAGEALALLSARTFDVVAVDSLLGDADELLSQARALGLSAVATGPHRELLERAARRHAVATLEKPFAAPALLALARARAPGHAA